MFPNTFLETFDTFWYFFTSITFPGSWFKRPKFETGSYFLKSIKQFCTLGEIRLANI